MVLCKESLLSRPTADDFSRLSNNHCVVQLLTPQTAGASFIVISVEEGEVFVGSEQAENFPNPFPQTNARERREKEGLKAMVTDLATKSSRWLKQNSRNF
jgi:hypothetical protein